MSELKPCPLCGGDDVVVSQVTTGGGWGVLCRGCHVYQDTRAEFIAEAIAAWNRRPDAPSAGEWMPIETAPKDGAKVLLLIGGVVHTGMWDGPSDGAIYAGRPSLYNWFSLSDGNTHADRAISHWMPEPALPAPPQADGGEG